MRPVPSVPPAYDEVRRKLHELGYLDGRIGRFVLRDLAGGAARAAAKASLLGGPLLGGLLAAQVVAANRPLARAVDALVLWLYLALLATAALFLLDLAAATVTAAIARRRGVRSGDTVRASLLVALPTLAFLVASWVRRPAGATLAADLAFFAAAGSATLFVAWLGGMVSLAGIIGGTGTVPDRARRPLISVVVGVIALVAAGVGARAIATRGESRPTPAAPFEIAPAADRLVLLGVDGLDGDLVAALQPDGAVDALLDRLESGAVFPLRRPAAQEPPQVWTTIATGVTEDVHGVRGAGVVHLPFVATPLRREGSLPLAAALGFLPPTHLVPASGVARRALALWEIASLREGSASIGWWASWPAREGEGAAPAYVVSDRVLTKLLAGRENDRDAVPSAFFARLAARVPADRDAIRARFDERFDEGDAEVARLAWESFLIDAWNLEVARSLLADPAVRAAFVYLPGLDILRHRLPLAVAGSARAVGAQRTLSAYVGWLTGSLALLTASAPSGRGTTIVLVADPGRSAGAGADGFVSVVGARATAGCVAGGISDLDVTPLTLELMGFPTSAEMPGRVPSDCLAPPGASRPAVATFGRKGAAGRAPRGEDDPELLERLRSLGYIR